jgi:uncharacterized delta-60 repeat protein
VLVLALLIGLGGWPAWAASGDLDTTFGGDGKVMTNFTRGRDPAFSVAIQADGKIVAVGTANSRGTDARFALARYEVNGTLDPTFGGDGKVTTNITPGDDRADELAIQSDGKIVVAGTADYFSNRARLALVRYGSNGSRDATFGGDGLVTTQLTPTFDGAFGVAIQSDMDIVAAGQAGGGDAGRVGVVRYDTAGAKDSTFGGGDGVVLTNFTRRLDYADDVVIDSSGKIVVAGAIRFFGPDPRFALARYATDGTLDASFGGDGKVTTDFGAGMAGTYGVDIQPADGNIVAVGPAGGLGGRFGVARYVA